MKLRITATDGCTTTTGDVASDILSDRGRTELVANATLTLHMRHGHKVKKVEPAL